MKKRRILCAFLTFHLSAHFVDAWRTRARLLSPNVFLSKPFFFGVRSLCLVSLFSLNVTEKFYGYFSVYFFSLLSRSWLVVFFVFFFVAFVTGGGGLNGSVCARVVFRFSSYFCFCFSKSAFHGLLIFLHQNEHTQLALFHTHTHQFSRRKNCM